MYQIWRIYLDLWGHDCKEWVWPTFGCKLGQSDPIVMQLKLDMSYHLLNLYIKFQIDISKRVEEKSGKRGRTDGRTDRRTDGHCHGIIRSFCKRAYKNGYISINIFPVMGILNIKNRKTALCLNKYHIFVVITTIKSMTSFTNKYWRN